MKERSNISLKPLDDIFSTEESRADAQREKVTMVLLEELHPFRNHPFKVLDDEKMMDTAQSIREHGVLVPAIVRPLESGGYELVSGHRRKRGCELAGLAEMPVIIRDMDDDTATLYMVDSNIQRETILPSERAFAYKMKLEALRHQGQKALDQVGPKWSLQEIGKAGNDSMTQVKRFIRLTELISELLSMVDERRIAFNPAVELSYLSREEQSMLLDAMDAEQATPSLSQAQRLKRFSQEGKLTWESMSAIMSEEKKPEVDKVTLTGDKLHKYFPKSYTPRQMEDTIIKLLEGWHRKQMRSMER